MKCRFKREKHCIICFVKVYNQQWYKQKMIKICYNIFYG